MKQSISLNSVMNARELGGYINSDGRTIKHGLLLRSGKLSDISDGDIRALRDKFRLCYIVDLRMETELEGARDPEIEGAEYIRLDVVDLYAMLRKGLPGINIEELDELQMTELLIRHGVQNDRMYIDYLSGELGKKAYAELFRILLDAEPDRAVLWHCTGGKDRTGLAAMLILSALGVNEQAVIDDYLLSNEYNSDRIAQTRAFFEEKGYEKDFVDAAVIMHGAVGESYMKNALDWLKGEYGSVLGYITDALGITREEIARLKEKYLI